MEGNLNLRLRLSLRLKLLRDLCMQSCPMAAACTHVYTGVISSSSHSFVMMLSSDHQTSAACSEHSDGDGSEPGA